MAAQQTEQVQKQKMRRQCAQLLNLCSLWPLPSETEAAPVPDAGGRRDIPGQSEDRHALA